VLEPDAVKAASPVLRGARHSNVPGLPDMSSAASNDRFDYVDPHRSRYRIGDNSIAADQPPS
jgi:hypothetical protein